MQAEIQKESAQICKIDWDPSFAFSIYIFLRARKDRLEKLKAKVAGKSILKEASKRLKSERGRT